MREATARNMVDWLKTFSFEYKQLCTRSVQTLENLVENPELHTLEVHLQEAM